VTTMDAMCTFECRTQFTLKLSSEHLQCLTPEKFTFKKLIVMCNHPLMILTSLILEQKITNNIDKVCKIFHQSVNILHK